MKKARSILCILVLMLTVPAVLALRGQLPVNTQPLIEKKYGEWAGVLRLWYAQTWEPGGGSVAPWLYSCVKTFEKRHPGVYIQPEAVEIAAMADIGRDNLPLPDLVLFPAGIQPGGIVEESVPVMLGGYMWAYNADMIDGIPRTWRNVDMPVAAPPDDAGHCWGAALLALCSGRYSEDAPTAPESLSGEMDLGLAGEAAPTASPTPEDGELCCQLPEGFAFSATAYSDFINGEAAAMPVTQREIRRLAELSAQGRGVNWRLAGGAAVFTDQAMCVACTAQAEDGRDALCRGFIEHLLSDECQSGLSKIGAFSATGTPSGYGPGDPLGAMDALLRLPGRVTPDPEDAEWRGAAETIVRKFIGGDPDAAGLWGLLRAIIRGKAEH